MEQVALGQMTGSLWRYSLFKRCSPHPYATGTGVRLSPTPHCTALSFGTSEEMQNSAGSWRPQENQLSCLEKAALSV